MDASRWFGTIVTATEKWTRRMMGKKHKYKRESSSRPHKVPSLTSSHLNGFAKVATRVAGGQVIRVSLWGNNASLGVSMKRYIRDDVIY